MPTGDEITVTVTGSITDFGTATNLADYDIITEDTYPYVTVNSGTLAVTAKAVTITVNDAGKTVGDPDPAFTGTVDGLVNSDDLGDVTYYRTNTDEAVGTYDDVLSADYTANDNYDVTIVPGDFTIATPIIIENDSVIVITANSNSWTYDGASHSDNGFTITCDGTAVTADGDGKYFLPNGDEITVTVTGSITDFGTATNLADYDIITEDTYPYVTVNSGTLAITAKPVTITVNDADKFVGEADPSFSGTIDGLINAGDLGTVSYYRTNLTEDSGTYTGIITAGYTENSNYDVTVIPADFTINPLLNDEDHFAYIIGYPDGSVGPERNITRAEVATIFYRLLTEETLNAYSTNPNPFSDVPDGAWYSTAVLTLYALNIVNGYPDNTFHPNGYITRAEFAAIAARFDGSGDTTPTGFTDIAGHWAEDEINIAANNGWVEGYEDHSFRPDLYITRAEAVTLINNVLNRIPASPEDLLSGMIIWPDNTDTTKWYYLAIQEATNSHDYERNGDGTETWTVLLPNIDWTH